jgi:hypothetical protein
MYEENLSADEIQIVDQAWAEEKLWLEAQDLRIAIDRALNKMDVLNPNFKRYCVAHQKAYERQLRRGDCWALSH